MSEMTVVGTENEQDVIRILGNSLYPGAKPESIRLVLAYCRANGMDPFLKPVHIVPTSIKVSSDPDRWEMRDVLMPGIADYRIKAARSGEYGGKSEPEFGPDVTTTLGGTAITYPSWCRVTVRRIVQGQAREFVANERWLENYATARRNSDAPNKMWKKRAYGQLAKCAESQALRMAFPEFSAGYTAEEMEGRDTFDGPTIDAEPPPPSRRDAINAETPLRAAATAMPRAATVRAPAPVERTEAQWRVWLDKLHGALGALYHVGEAEDLARKDTVAEAHATGPDHVRAEIDRMLAETYARLAKPADAPAGAEAELPEVEIVGQEKMAAGD